MSKKAKRGTRKVAKQKATATRRKDPAPVSELEVVKHKSKLMQMLPTPFGKMGVPFEANAEEVQSVCTHDLPLIPLELFYQVLSWQRHLAKEHRCETHTSLFLIEGEWVAEPFFQENNTSAMTIKVDYFSEKNQERYNYLMERAERGIHATIHNHVTAAAHQSGTDEEDEKGLCGPHITIGKMQEQEIDYHGRFSVIANGRHRFIPMRLSDIIDIPLPTVCSWKQIEMAEKMVLTTVPKVRWPEEWNDKFTLKTYRGGTSSGKTTGGGASKVPDPTPRTEAASASDCKPINEKDVNLRMAPWGPLAILDTTTWASFKASIEQHRDNLGKPITAILTHYGCSLHAIYIALNAKKIREGIDPVASSA